VKEKRISTGKSLDSFLASIIDESVKSALHQRALQEKENQEATAAATSEQGALPPEDEKTLEKGDVDVDDVIENLNSIRSGRSFKDESVKASMQEYVDSLEKAEKTALLAFLKAISQIVVGQLPAQQAIDPSEKPSNVKMQKGDSVQKKSIKPNVIKAQIQQPEKKASVEDTTAPVPISPKKK